MIEGIGTGALVKAGTTVIVLGLATGWWHARDERLRAEGRAEHAIAVRDSAVAVADSLVRESARVDSAATARIQWAETQRVEAERRAERAASRRPEIVEKIVHAPDSAAVRSAVEELEAAHEEEVMSLRDAIAAADSVIGAKRSQLLVRAEAIDDLQAALRASRQVAEALRQDRPGFFERWGTRVGWAAGGAVVGYLAGRGG